MPDAERLMRLGRLRELEAELPELDAHVRNDMEAIRRHMVGYRTPADIFMDGIRAAVKDLEEHHAAYLRADKEAAALREQLGVS